MKCHKIKITHAIKPWKIVVLKLFFYQTSEKFSLYACSSLFDFPKVIIHEYILWTKFHSISLVHLVVNLLLNHQPQGLKKYERV